MLHSEQAANFASYLHCLTALRSALSNILQVHSLPFCNLLLQGIVPTNNCTEQDCSAHLLIALTAGEGLLSCLVLSSALVLLKGAEVQGGEICFSIFILLNFHIPPPLKAIP